MGLRSTSSVQYNLNVLEELGYIERGDSNLKSSHNFRHKGYARALPTFRFSVRLRRVSRFLRLKALRIIFPVPINAAGEELFALHVRGDSMINASICDGDIVIVERTPVAENGDIVVALIGDEATVKRFYKENGHFRLQPENDNYEPIIVDELAPFWERIKRAYP